MVEPKINIPNRKQVRDILASVIRGAGTDYQVVYPYQNDDLGGQSPVLRIMSSASNRPVSTFQGAFATFGFTLQSLVLYRDEQGTSAWTPDLAEDKLDDLEHQLAHVFLFSEWPQTGLIKSIQYAANTHIRRDVIQGKTYLAEYIPINVEAFYG